MNNWGHATALIGHTGFVGSNLARQSAFSACFNSGNIDEIAGQSFDTIVCAGVQAVKWKANKDPAADWAGITRLLEPLKETQARRFILISTIDVYANPSGVTEDEPASQENHAYGVHRRKVEEFVQEHFADSYIVRLPGLFGEGLKKNVIYDLLHDNCLEAIQPMGSFQYYWLKHLNKDLLKVVNEGIRVLNLATEPIQTRAIVERYFGGRTIGASSGPAVHYDFRSRYDRMWGCRGGYLYDGEAVLGEIGHFIAEECVRLHHAI
jgi:hypothetical protein